MSAWTVIAHTEVGSGGAANITFSSISSSYTDLLLVYSLRSSRSGELDDPVAFTFNSATTNYSERYILGSGSGSPSSGTFATSFLIGGYMPAASVTANTFGNGVIYIPNYAGSQAKSVSVDHVHENNATTAYQSISAALWNDSTAISSIVIKGQISNLVQYSSATLYGITKGSSGGVSVS
jgi:hypothetical protein